MTTTTSSDIPLPSPPFIDVPGLRNFRDAGGYPVVTGPTSPSSSSSPAKPKIVRRGVLFRASEPSRVTDAGVRVLAEDLRIATVYDLRSRAEMDLYAPREWPGAERVFCPVFADEDYAPEAVARRFSNFARDDGSEGFVQVYTRILEAGVDPAGYRPFPLVLRHLASSPSSGPPAPILVHCTAGKDRTGVLVALVLSLCGVPDDAVAHEYSLTDLGLGERRDEFIDHLVRAPGGPLFGDRAAAARMVCARASHMRATLAMVRARWGGVEQFVVAEGGLTPDEVARLKANLVVELGEGEAPLAWEEHAKLVDGLRG